MIDDVLNETRDGMKNSVKSLEDDLGSIRTGRASTSLVDKLRVDYYGTPTPLIQLALISVPEPQLISIRPYDATSIKDIERAIMQSDIGITPNNDGKIIRLQIPSLTEDRRKSLARKVNERVEDGRVSVRNHRRDGLELLRMYKDDKDISEDEFYRGKDELEKLTQEYIKKVDEVGKKKEDEITTI